MSKLSVGIESVAKSYPTEIIFPSVLQGEDEQKPKTPKGKNSRTEQPRWKENEKKDKMEQHAEQRRNMKPEQTMSTARPRYAQDAHARIHQDDSTDPT